MDKKMLKRTRLFITFVLVIFLLLSARLAHLQILQHEHYWSRAETNRMRILPITAPRGEIFDQQGNQVVTNRPGFTVSMVDLGTGYDEETVSRLGELLEMDEEEIMEKIKSQYYRRYVPVRLKNNVDEEIVAQIAEHRIELPGVLIEVQPIRDYVSKNVASHIIGYLGDSPMEEWIVERWKEEDYEYQTGDLVGQKGLELVWEPILRGEDGGVQVEVNVTGQAIKEYERVDPQPGSDLYLTIDLSFQREVENILKEAVAYQREEEENLYAGEAAAVALEPDSGRILAMASIPAYDPNTFRQDYRSLQEDSRRPLTNKAIADHYPVGSSFKMVTAVAALEEGVIGRNSTVTCRGTLTRYGATKSCYRGTVHGSLNIIEAITRSCNIFFYEMGLKAGIDSLAHYSREFGFGSPTGLTDILGEKSGTLASRDFKQQVYNETWYPAETMDAAIGQSFHSFTPLQMANYTALIANGGVHYRPYLVEKVIDSEDNVVMMAEPEVLNYMDVNAGTWEAVREGMEKSTRPGGTAGHLAELPFEIAGKTGTVQVEGTGGSIPNHSIFVAYAPTDDPEIALVVFIKHGGTGGETAAPAAGEILKEYFDLEMEEYEDGPEGNSIVDGSSEGPGT